MTTDFDWRAQVILQKLTEGCLYREAAAAAGMTKQGLWWRMGAHPGFREAVAAAREEGKNERALRKWLAHPRRGMRPPAGRGHGGKPAFRYGRR